VPEDNKEGSFILTLLFINKASIKKNKICYEAKAS